MQALADRLQEFAAGLLDPRVEVPAGLVGPDGEPSPRRYAVYRNNAVVGITEALKSNYPAVCRIVGEEFFGAMARRFIVLEPPTSPVLIEYGSGLPSFIGDFAPTATLPYLADVARLEWLWLEAHHSAEARPLEASDLAGIPADQAVNLVFDLHYSLQMLRSLYPVLTIWQMNVGDGMPAPVNFDNGENVLVLRPEADVTMRSMPPGAYEFVDALAKRNTLGAAMLVAAAAERTFDLANNIAALIAAGAFIGWRIKEDSSSIEIRR